MGPAFGEFRAIFCFFLSGFQGLGEIKDLL